MRRVLVVGPGALGILFAVRLARAGHTVAMAGRPGSALPASYTAYAPDGEAQGVTLPAARTDDGFDVIILATKLPDAADALARWLPCLADDGAVVTLQNGILPEAVVRLAGDRLLACTVGLPASLEGPGISRQTGPGELIMGPWPDARQSPATPDLGTLFTAVAPCRMHQNMLGVQWNKLAVNAAITGLGAMTGQPLGVMLADRRGRDAVIDIFTEARAAGRAEGVRFEGVSGLHVDRIAMDGRNPITRRLRHGVLRIVGRKYGAHRSSSLQSLERGRPTEVPALNGHIADVAARHGIPAPVNAAIAAQVAKIEAGDDAPSMAHLGPLPVRFH